MDKEELIEWRRAYETQLLTELVVRTSVQLQTLLLREQGRPDASLLDGAKVISGVIQAMGESGASMLLAGNLPAVAKQMHADEYREAAERLQHVVEAFAKSQK